jgi:SAM-dependent methyltransferase
MPNPTIVYPAYLASAAHPDHMAVRAQLRGFTSPPPDRARVLELGCGAGWSLLAFGFALPGSEFVGVDLFAPAIAQGREWVDRMGMKNVDLRAADVMEIDEADGQFDYIFAHGFISWVPEPVRRKTFEIIRDRLAPNGVAYLSFNSYPGGHLREMVRGMLRFHTRNLTTDADRIAQAHGLLAAMVEPPVPETSFHYHLTRVIERMKTLPGEQILFDELGEVNHHLYFHEFVTMAASFGLEFLGDGEFADFSAMLPPKQQATLARIGDRLTREQYLDFFIGRAFRQTMLCRAGMQQARPDAVEAVRRLWIGGPMECQQEDGEGMQRWAGASGAAVSTSHAPAQAAFARMGEAWPRLLSGRELLDGVSAPSDALFLANVLVQCIEGGLIRGHVVPPPAAHRISDRPCASALARAQIGQRFVSSLSCEAIELSSDDDERLLALLDGTLSHAELAARLSVDAGDLEASLLRFVRHELIQ